MGSGSTRSKCDGLTMSAQSSERFSLPRVGQSRRDAPPVLRPTRRPAAKNCLPLLDPPPLRHSRTAHAQCTRTIGRVTPTASPRGGTRMGGVDEGRAYRSLSLLRRTLGAATASSTSTTCRRRLRMPPVWASVSLGRQPAAPRHHTSDCSGDRRGTRAVMNGRRSRIASKMLRETTNVETDRCHYQAIFDSPDSLDDRCDSVRVGETTRTAQACRPSLQRRTRRLHRTGGTP